MRATVRYGTGLLDRVNTTSGASYRWMIKFSIEGDLRFISHHDTMRVVERLCCRAGLSLRYTQGFNPHPIISLPSPRPVGVTARDDRMVISLDSPMDPENILQRLNNCTIRGMKFISATPLEKKDSATPKQIDHELPLTPRQASVVKDRIDKLNAQETWMVQRGVKSRRGGGRRKKGSDNKPSTRTMDIRTRIAEMRVENLTLHFSCVAKDETWARPGELLGLLDLPVDEELSRLVRTKLL